MNIVFLAFGELEAPAGLGLAVFLPLNNARISGQIPAFLQRASQLRLLQRQRLGNAMSHGARLAR